jgi:hypothetical protein
MNEELTSETIVLQTIENISKWKTQRANIITDVKKIIEKLNKTQRKVDISKLTGNTVAAVGVGLTVVGLVMTPFTLGLSLGVVAAGGGLGVVGSLTSGGANKVNFLVSKSELKIVEEMLENDRKLLDNIRKAKIKDNNLAENVILYLSLSNLLQNFSEGLINNTIQNSAKMMNKSIAVLNIFGIIFSVYDLIETAISLQNGSKSELANKLEEIINEMEKELQL